MVRKFCNDEWYLKKPAIALELEAVIQGCSLKKGVLRNFTKYTGKHQCQSLFFNKFAGLRPEACNFIKKESLAQVFSCGFCEISKNSFFKEHLWWLPLSCIWINFISSQNILAVSSGFLQWHKIRYTQHDGNQFLNEDRSCFTFRKINGNSDWKQSINSNGLSS